MSTNQKGKVLVTGGTGFLGAYILKNLVEKGFDVRATRRSPKLPSFIPEAILQKVEWVEAEVLDVVSLEEAMEDVSALIHAAAIVSFDQKDRNRMYQVNVEGTANVVNCAIESGITRMIHVSSVAALGRTTKAGMVTEERKWEENSSNTHYAISKHHAEMHVYRGFAEGLEGVMVNPSTILGYGDWNQSSCAIFKNAYKGFAWYTKGINGFVGVEEVAEATVQLLDSGLNQQRFIINADNWPFQKLFNTIADNFGKQRPTREASRAMGELAWRLEGVKAMVTGSKPLLTRETAKVAQSQTSFDNSALLAALPGFNFTPLETVIANSCEKYKAALGRGEITL
jgi:nucleoside-diphosphate-sugar epimerase